MANDLAIPKSASDITEAWVQSLFFDHSNGRHINMVNVEESLQKGDNFMSTMLFVQAEDTDGERYQLVLKLSPEGQNHLALVRDMRAFEKEVEFYNKILPDMKTCFPKMSSIGIPKCFYAAVSEESAILVLQDIRPHGYKMKPKLQGLDFSHVQIALKELAKFHAAGYGLKEKYADTLMERYPFMGYNHFNEKFGAYLNKAGHQCVDLMKRYGMDGVKVLRLQKYIESHNLYERRDKLVNSCKDFATVCHGDCWNNNFLFRPSELEPDKPYSVSFVDFQLCRYAHPAIDLSYLLLTSTNRETRTSHLKYLLFTYYDNLFSNLKAFGVNFTRDNYPYELFVQDYEDLSEYGFLVCVFLVPKVLQEGEHALNVDNEEEWDKHHHDNKSAGMTAVLKRMADAVEDMMEKGLF